MVELQPPQAQQQQQQQQAPVLRRSQTDSARERRHQRIAALQRKDKASFSQRQHQQQPQQAPLLLMSSAPQPQQPIVVFPAATPAPTAAVSVSPIPTNNSGRRPPSPSSANMQASHHFSSLAAPSSPGRVVVGAMVSIFGQDQQHRSSPSRAYSPTPPQQHGVGGGGGGGVERGASPVMGVSNNHNNSNSNRVVRSPSSYTKANNIYSTAGTTRPPIRMVSPHGGVSLNNNNIMMPVLHQAASWDAGTGSSSTNNNNNNHISPASHNTSTPPSPPRASSFLALKRRNSGSSINNVHVHHYVPTTPSSSSGDRSVSSEGGRGGFMPVHGKFNHAQQHHRTSSHQQHSLNHSYRPDGRPVVSDTGGDTYNHHHHHHHHGTAEASADFGYKIAPRVGGVGVGSGDHAAVYGPDIPMDEQSADHSIGGGDRCSSPYTPGSPSRRTSSPQPRLLPKSSLLRPNSRGPPAVMVVEMNHLHHATIRGSSSNSVGGGGACAIVNALRTSSQDADEMSSLGVGLDEEQNSTNNSTNSNNNSPRGGGGGGGVGGGYYNTATTTNARQRVRNSRGGHSRSPSPSPRNHNLLRLIAAVQTGEVTGGIASVLGGISTTPPPPAPSQFSSEERILWEAIQTAILNQKSTLSEQQQHQQPQQSITSTTEGSTSSELSESLASAERERLLQEKSTEHDMALRAIRRVLADITDQRDKATTELEELQENVQTKKQAWRAQLEAKNQQIVALLASSSGRKTPEMASNNTAEVVTELREQIRVLQSDNEHLTSEADAKNKQLSKLKRHLHVNDKTDSNATTTNEENSQLRKELAEKSSALENAKMIIASLEQSSGSLASDTRFKLKAKDSEIAGLKRDASHQQKNLDTLATELRDVQTERAKLEDRLSLDRNRVVTLKMTLEENMKELRDACAILETTRDSGDMDKISDILADAVEAFKKSIEAVEDPHNNDMDSIASARSMSSRASRENSAAMTMTRDSSSVVRRMEEEMRKLKEEALHYRLEAERIEQQRESDKQTLYAEIQMLRVHCNTNMEVLTKKERELAVLRDSLRVEDDVGYISDDGDEDDDDDPINNPPSTPTTTPIVSQEYGHLQAEALATLLAHGSQSGSFDMGSIGGHHSQPQQQQQQAVPPPPPPAPVGSPPNSKLKQELSQARKERERAMKELKTEKESLANAKMIISSLERANKSMMVDLHSRLHDSNTAIASLLEKSMESEKSTAKLRAELESLRSEKERVEDEYEARLANLRRNSGSKVSTNGNNDSAGGGVKNSSNSSGALTVVSMEEKKEDIITETID